MFAPAVAGTNAICAVQLLPLLNVAPQVVEPIAKLLDAWPETWKPTFAIGAPPVLFTVSISGELAAPTSCVPKQRRGGPTLITGACKPVPESATVCVRIASEIVSVPVCVPAAVGVNKTLIEQLEF